MADSREHERYRIPNAGALFGDTWAEDLECPNCGATVATDQSQCKACWQWIGECGRSCPGCPSPRCVGDQRPDKKESA